MSQLTILFKTNGEAISIQCTSSELFAEAAFKYMNKKGIDQATQEPVFVFNGKTFKKDNCKRLEELGIKNSSVIEVTLLQEIIGA